ncbi:myeloid leukemia factor isoform X3 [Calliopsis andreniformis]|uniref:myeloid leukemia factor isoform X3 n=1 Tax=Calliopsis andreniformis TaxID=337506 RepID=UPI003FCCBFE6
MYDRLFSKMSLFGSAMSDLDDDPIFGFHLRSMRHMNDMMNSLFNDPFGMMGQNAITDGTHRNRSHQDNMQMMPFGFSSIPPFPMGRFFTDFNNMAQGGNCHSFTSTSVMTTASGPDGCPQVYQETMSTRTAPGGVKETKKTVCDSRTGLKKMAIGHHIGDRAHILEREQNLHSGEQEERQEFINLDEDEAETFNNEWESRTRRATGAIGSSHHGVHGHRNHRSDHRQLALPSPSGSSDSCGNTKSGTKPTPGVSSTNAIRNRKRERTPDAQVCKKRYSVSHSDV